MHVKEANRSSRRGRSSPAAASSSSCLQGPGDGDPAACCRVGRADVAASASTPPSSVGGAHLWGTVIVGRVVSATGPLSKPDAPHTSTRTPPDGRCAAGGGGSGVRRGTWRTTRSSTRSHAAARTSASRAYACPLEPLPPSLAWLHPLNQYAAYHIATPTDTHPTPTPTPTPHPNPPNPAAAPGQHLRGEAICARGDDPRGGSLACTGCSAQGRCVRCPRGRSGPCM